MLYRESTQSLDFRSSFLKNDSKKSTENMTVVKSLSSCEDSTCEYAKLLIIYNCLQEIARDGRGETFTKLKNLMAFHNIKKYMHLPNETKDTAEELTLLGLIDIDLSKYEFSLEEQALIKKHLEARLKNKVQSFNNT